MEKAQTVIKNATGLHARPASLFVKKASEFKSDIKISTDEKEVNAKSIMSVMSLGAGKGTKVSILAEGIDEKKAVLELVKFLDEEMNE